MTSLLIWITTLTAVVASLTGMVVYIGGISESDKHTSTFSAVITLIGAAYMMSRDEMVSVSLIMAVYLGILLLGWIQ